MVVLGTLHPTECISRRYVDPSFHAIGPGEICSEQLKFQLTAMRFQYPPFSSHSRPSCVGERLLSLYLSRRKCGYMYKLAPRGVVSARAPGARRRPQCRFAAAQECLPLSKFSLIRQSCGAGGCGGCTRNVICHQQYWSFGACNVATTINIMCPPKPVSLANNCPPTCAYRRLYYPRINGK